MLVELTPKYHEYELETVFIRETSRLSEVVDIRDLFERE
jgi:hypothetical protein